MDAALPELGSDIASVFTRYEAERARRPDERFEVVPVDQEEPDAEDLFVGDVPCAVETQRQLGSRLRNHL